MEGSLTAGLMPLFQALQDTGFATALRSSRFAYPIVNAGHIVGIAVLVGAILPLDLRLIGCWRSVPLPLLARVLLPMAVGGLVLAIVTGALLFSVHAVEYARTDIFGIKLLIVAAAVANALLLGRSALRAQEATGADIPSVTRLRLIGLASAGLWLAAILCGRWIAYV